MITASPPRKARSCARRAPRRLAFRASCAVALAMLLAAPAALASAGHGARCATVRGRRSHACAQSRRTRTSSGRRARPHRKAAHPHGRARSGSHQTTLRTLPTCEDGSAAVKAAGATLRCADSSEPGCEPPSVPTLSPSGTLRFCAAPAHGEAGCEAGQECVHAEGLPEAPCGEGEGEAASAASGEEACGDESEPAAS